MIIRSQLGAGVWRPPPNAPPYATGSCRHTHRFPNGSSRPGGPKSMHPTRPHGPHHSEAAKSASSPRRSVDPARTTASVAARPHGLSRPRRSVPILATARGSGWRALAEAGGGYLDSVLGRRHSHPTVAQRHAPDTRRPAQLSRRSRLGCGWSTSPLSQPAWAGAPWRSCSTPPAGRWCVG